MDIPRKLEEIQSAIEFNNCSISYIWRFVRFTAYELTLANQYDAIATLDEKYKSFCDRQVDYAYLEKLVFNVDLCTFSEDWFIESGFDRFSVRRGTFQGAKQCWKQSVYLASGSLPSAQQAAAAIEQIMVGRDDPIRAFIRQQKRAAACITGAQLTPTQEIEAWKLLVLQGSDSALHFIRETQRL